MQWRAEQLLRLGLPLHGLLTLVVVALAWSIGARGRQELLRRAQALGPSQDRRRGAARVTESG
jgi:hypothetical protein